MATKQSGTPSRDLNLWYNTGYPFPGKSIT